MLFVLFQFLAFNSNSVHFIACDSCRWPHIDDGKKERFLSMPLFLELVPNWINESSARPHAGTTLEQLYWFGWPYHMCSHVFTIVHQLPGRVAQSPPTLFPILVWLCLSSFQVWTAKPCARAARSKTHRLHPPSPGLAVWHEDGSCHDQKSPKSLAGDASRPWHLSKTLSKLPWCVGPVWKPSAFVARVYQHSTCRVWPLERYSRCDTLWYRAANPPSEATASLRARDAASIVPVHQNSLPSGKSAFTWCTKDLRRHK